jgi:hypothetical protein
VLARIEVPESLLDHHGESIRLVLDAVVHNERPVLGENLVGGVVDPLLERLGEQRLAVGVAGERIAGKDDTVCTAT